MFCNEIYLSEGTKIISIYYACIVKFLSLMYVDFPYLCKFASIEKINK